MTKPADEVKAFGERLAAEHQERTAKELRDRMIDVHSSAFNHATTYSVVVIFGGYAALFTIWTYTKEYAAPEINVWIGLTLGISVLTFVLFEVFQMLMITMATLKVRQLISHRLTPDEFLKRFERLQTQNNIFVLWIILPVWGIALVVTLISGISAAALLIYTFAEFLL